MTPCGFIRDCQFPSSIAAMITGGRYKGSASAPSRNEFLPAGLNPSAVAEPRVSWERPFDQPVPLPNGPPARTLRDAAKYIRKLPKQEYDAPEWRLAIHMLMDAAENRGPMLFAKMGIERALNRHAERVFDPARKDTHWGKRKLARDR
jgi:hypothetical protein